MMNEENKGFNKNASNESMKKTINVTDPEVKKGPLSFISGALTSYMFAWISFVLSQKLLLYFSLHKPNYSSAIALSIASGFKTLIIGISFLATFTFGFIGIGLTLVFLRSLLDVSQEVDS